MLTPKFKALNFAREIRGRHLNGSVFKKKKGLLQRVLVDCTLWKKGHACHATLAPVQRG